MTSWLADSGNASAHAVAWCLAHRKRVFLQGWGPDAGHWLHLNNERCQEAL